jgi:tRNA-specific 2-thiouridylase
MTNKETSLGELKTGQSAATDGELVVVAMSGGVDSSAAALLLADQGYSVVGVSMQVWDYRKNGGSSTRATCCAPADFDDARQVADVSGFPFYVFDFEDSFHEAVIQPFVQSYLGGRTPNPCVDCNRKVKFAELRGRGRALGARYVATGHYAQIKDSLAAPGRPGLFTARDRNKDQSYFLYALTEGELKSTLFPIGSMTKPFVREFLRQRGFAVAEKRESQDICFVSGTVAEFIEREFGKQEKCGEIVDSTGAVRGRHNGIQNYTVGQRRGLGLSNPDPLYVLAIDPEENRVRVGTKSELEQDRFTVKEFNWLGGLSDSSQPFEAVVKVRYRHGGVRCRITPLGGRRAELQFLGEWTPVSPGQAAVIYNGQPDSSGDFEVLGGGIIERADEMGAN